MATKSDGTCDRQTYVHIQIKIGKDLPEKTLEDTFNIPWHLMLSFDPSPFDVEVCLC